MTSLEVGFTAPGGDASPSLLPSLLHASFASRPVQSRVDALVDLLRNVSAPAVVAAPPGVSAPGAPAAPTSAPKTGHSRQLKIYFASPRIMSLDAQLSSLAAAGESGIVPFIDSVTREKSIPLLRILIGITSPMPTELGGLCSILTLRAHLVKYWFSVLFASLVDPVSLVPSIPADVAKYKDEWLAGDGVLFAQHILDHTWEKIDWWGLHAFAQRCQLGGTIPSRPVGSHFVDGEAHRIVSPYVDRLSLRLIGLRMPSPPRQLVWWSCMQRRMCCRSILPLRLHNCGLRCLLQCQLCCGQCKSTSRRRLRILPPPPPFLEVLVSDWKVLRMIPSPLKSPQT